MGGIFEDIAAVVDSLGEPANLLGHSFGGVCALEAALLTRHIRKLVLYEAAIGLLPGVAVYPEGFIDRIQALLDAGDREGVLNVHYAENVGMSPDEIEQMRSSPAWWARVATAHTLPRPLRLTQAVVVSPRVSTGPILCRCDPETHPTPDF